MNISIVIADQKHEATSAKQYDVKANEAGSSSFHLITLVVNLATKY